MAQEQLLALFTALKDLEFAVSELYGTFSLKSEGPDKEFWNQLRMAELKHVKNINTMVEQINNNPNGFINGRPITVKTINMVADSIRRHTLRTASGEISSARFLALAIDVESSLLENKYHEIAKTSDPRFNALTTIIMADTRAHAESLRNRKK